MLVSSGISGILSSCCLTHRTVRCWQVHFCGQPIASVAVTSVASTSITNARGQRCQPPRDRRGGPGNWYILMFERNWRFSVTRASSVYRSLGWVDFSGIVDNFDAACSWQPDDATDRCLFYVNVTLQIGSVYTQFSDVHHQISLERSSSSFALSLSSRRPTIINSTNPQTFIHSKGLPAGTFSCFLCFFVCFTPLFQRWKNHFRDCLSSP